jgi:hypothetical protein
MVGLVLSLLVWVNLPGRLEIGADGLLVDWRGKKRYVSFADLVDSPPYAESMMGKRMIGVSLVLRSGERVKVPIGEDQFGADKKVAELSRRVRAALERYAHHEHGADAVALARGDRTAEAWLARLRAMSDEANAAPREAPVPADRLWGIVEDPAAPASARAGAAFALAPKLDDDGKSRLRVAADATVLPKLRVALESAISGSDEEAVAALEAIDAEKERAWKLSGS